MISYFLIKNKVFCPEWNSGNKRGMHMDVYLVCFVCVHMCMTHDQSGVEASPAVGNTIRSFGGSFSVYIHAFATLCENANRIRIE